MHFALFLSVLIIGIGLLKLGNPTTLAVTNETITASSIADLKPFLTAVGLLMALLLTTVLVTGRTGNSRQKIEAPKPPVKKQADDSFSTELAAINRQLESIRRRI
jgi:hypothetical protein